MSARDNQNPGVNAGSINKNDNQSTNDFPKLGITTNELITWTERMLKKAAEEKNDMGAVNWGDLGIADIEYRLSVMSPDEGPYCVVLIEEASPECALAAWLFSELDRAKFPNTFFECGW